MSNKNGSSEEAYMSAMRKKLIAATRYIDEGMSDFMADSVQILELRIASPEKTGGDYRATIKGRAEDGSLFVSWVYADGLAELLIKIKSVGESRGIVWREDRPFPMLKDKSEPRKTKA